MYNFSNVKSIVEIDVLHYGHGFSEYLDKKSKQDIIQETRKKAVVCLVKAQKENLNNKTQKDEELYF